MNRVVGCVLLIIGTSIGGGLLALPVATAAGGFWLSSLLLIATWAVMMTGAFLILEVNLWLPEESHLVSMAKQTLGRWGEITCWCSYSLLLYSLLCAYVAGGTDLFHSLLLDVHLDTPHWIDTILFTAIFASIVWHGIRLIDGTNRALMAIKITAFLLLVFMILPLVKPTHLATGKAIYLLDAVMVVITSFGYAIILPSLRVYLKSNVKQLRRAILIGSLIPLICYIAWDYTVQGTIPKTNLIHMSQQGDVVSQLTAQLSSYNHNHWITATTHVFTSICVLTAFLGVSLALYDFLTDGLKLNKQGKQKLIGHALTFCPPLIIVTFYPNVFIEGLKYAGIFCVLVLIFLPAAMAYSGRYIKGIATGYRLWGGKLLLQLVLVASIALIGFATLYG